MSYPVAFEVDHVERRSRLTTFFRLLLAIPHFILLYLFGILATIAVFVAWVVIVITGRYPKGLYDFLAGFVRYFTQVFGYTVLLCDSYPSFGGSEDAGYPVRMSFAGPLESYSRAKTFFRFILVIPILIFRYVMGILLEVGAVASWFVILITGKMPRGLFDVMVLGSSYTARSDAYIYLLTETYPPFQDDHTRAAGVASA